MRKPVFLHLRKQRLRSAADQYFCFCYLLSIGRFQYIKTGVLLIFSFITGDRIEFLPPMMFLNDYITGI